MRGQALLATAAIILVIALLLLVAIPKRTLGPDPQIEDAAIQRREIEHMLRAAYEDALVDTAQQIEEVLNSKDAADSLANQLETMFKIQWEKKSRIYESLRGTKCDIRRGPQIEIAQRSVVGGGSMFYVESFYVEVTCNTGAFATLSSSAEVKAELRQVGAFGGLKLNVTLKRGSAPIYITSFGAMLYNETCGKGCWVRLPLLGTFDDAGRIWLFNTTAAQEIRIAIPPEYYLDGKYRIVVVAVTPGQGAGTLVVVAPTVPEESTTQQGP